MKPKEWKSFLFLVCHSSLEWHLLSSLSLCPLVFVSIGGEVGAEADFSSITFFVLYSTDCQLNNEALEKLATAAEKAAGTGKGMETIGTLRLNGR